MYNLKYVSCQIDSLMSYVHQEWLFVYGLAMKYTLLVGVINQIISKQKKAFCMYSSKQYNYNCFFISEFLNLYHY